MPPKLTKLDSAEAGYGGHNVLGPTQRTDHERVKLTLNSQPLTFWRQLSAFREYREFCGEEVGRDHAAKSLLAQKRFFSRKPSISRISGQTKNSIMFPQQSTIRVSTFGVSGVSDLDGVEVGRDHAGQLLLTQNRFYLANRLSKGFLVQKQEFETCERGLS